MNSKNYTIGKDNEGLDLCLFIIEWTDEQGQHHKVQTDDIDNAKTIIALLYGDIRLGDLES